MKARSTYTRRYHFWRPPAAALNALSAGGAGLFAASQRRYFVDSATQWIQKASVCYALGAGFPLLSLADVMHISTKLSTISRK